MFCKECGNQIPDRAAICMKCGVPTAVTQISSNGSNAFVRMLLPVGRSGYAIAAGYLGLFSPLAIVGRLLGREFYFVFAIFALSAIVFGILGIIDIRKNKDKHGMGRAVFGIAMGIISFFI